MHSPRSLSALDARRNLKMAKGIAGKPSASRKPGGEGLPYKDAASVVGGPIEAQAEAGLNPGKGVKGGPLKAAPKK